MGTSDLIPEKFAMYFASMNPLASKIYSDIEGIEDYLKAHGPPSMTYGEKCSVVDKFLIHDRLSKNDHPSNKLNKRLSDYHKYHLKSDTSLNSILDKGSSISEAELLQPVFYNDVTLDQDHESVLLMSVAPKKPEKYVYDESNYWIDEHSGVYSSCTEGQAKVCKLQQFLDSLPPPPQRRSSDHHHHKYRAPPIPTLKSPKSDTEDSYIIKPNGKANGGEDRYSKIDKIDTEAKAKSKYSAVAVPMFGGVMGDGPVPLKKSADKKQSEGETKKDGGVEDLPNQVQNKDLIAELQAKLKKGKVSVDATTPVGISPRSSTKMNKPKAPPPPPPGIVKPPGGAVKVTRDNCSTKAPAICGTSNSEMKATKEGNMGREKRNSEKEVSDDFVVDVSSPCKIVTQKTGLDFLDNW